MADPAYLLDTNICIYLIEGRNGALIARAQERLVGELVTSAVAYAEVMIGARAQSAEAVAESFFGLIPPLPFDAAAGLAYARLPFRRGNLDRLIAAHALALGLTLVTNNERDFADIAGLKVENWAR